MSVACDTTECTHNDGRGFCELEDVYISSAETGEPICQDAKFEEDDDELQILIPCEAD